MDVRDRVLGLGGCAVLGLAIAGLVAFGCAITSIGNREFLPAGVCLFAAAYAFQSIARVIYRD